ncbi:glycosyltransferase, partial [bacterium]|nr:glycosyltransferase [bacterium]
MSRSAPNSLYMPAGILSRSEAQEICTRAIKNSPAPETRVNINSSARADTRFALNQVTTSGQNADTTVTITAIAGNRSASVTTNRLDEASLSTAAKQAYEIAQLVPPNPERMPELGAQNYPAPRERAVTLPTPAERAAAAKKVTEKARAAGLIATGFIECRAGATALANSKGLFAYDASAVVTMTATVRSTDGTGEKLARCARAHPQVKLISFKRNVGQTAAMMAGIDHAKGAVIVPMDGDLQNDPADIGRLLTKMDEGYDVVSGWRKDRKDAFLTRTLPSKLANGLISWVSGVRLNDYG